MKKLIAILATITLFASCSKKDVAPKHRMTYKFYSSRVPYEAEYYSMTSNRQTVNQKTYEVTVDFDTQYYMNSPAKITSHNIGDTLRIEMSMDGKTAQMQIVTRQYQKMVTLTASNLK